MESNKLIFGYLLEVIIDYIICFTIAVKRFFKTISRMVLIICLPGLVVFTIGIIFYASFMIIGYFVFLAMVSPKTAEKIVREEIIPLIQNNM